jgi:hypothetical protein
MYARFVRFTDVEAQRIEERKTAAEERGTPVDIPATNVQIFHDPDQRTAIVIQHFDSEEDMKAAEAALDAMDPGETPGTRASVDRCELKFEVKP